MNILVFDTETTGLPDYKQPSEAPHQPHIVELAALLFDDATGELIETLHAIIRPDGWTIPDEAAAIHGITTERAIKEGRPEQAVLSWFMLMHERADLRVAHNESFDQSILRIAIKRYGAWESQEERDALADAFKASPSYCTMKAATKPCNLPPTPAMLAKGMKWNKNPNLQEAHQHFLGEPFDGAHGALADAHACARVYFAMQKALAA